MNELGEKVTRLEERVATLNGSLEHWSSMTESHEARIRKVERELAVLRTEQRQIEFLRDRVTILEGRVRRHTLYLSVTQVLLAVLGQFVPGDFVLGG